MGSYAHSKISLDLSEEATHLTIKAIPSSGYLSTYEIKLELPKEMDKDQLKASYDVERELMTIEAPVKAKGSGRAIPISIINDEKKEEIPKEEEKEHEGEIKEKEEQKESISEQVETELEQDDDDEEEEEVEIEIEGINAPLIDDTSNNSVEKDNEENREEQEEEEVEKENDALPIPSEPEADNEEDEIVSIEIDE
eukprot:CAMPEP_0117423904 /NCGR_PEP_ID=MMETSP0758-20121206/4428_1 /TAXON_ID=63605 /ORGANISM="Percolomonas cosmopolitus, Strain AE-1 (ATCC 50343)" /LENGTH=195 /DNA_ID=CAMNT_0005207359 /DNA_START=222 /DNA_END=806 /DNA_ORIENTATION=-